MADARRVMLRLAPAVMLAAALAMSVLALFVFVPHDRATELLYKHAGAARAQQFLRSVRDAQKAEKFVHSLQEREKAAARAGGLEAQVWGHDANTYDQKKTFQYFSTLRARLHSLQSMLAPAGNASSGGNETVAEEEAAEAGNNTNATEIEEDEKKLPPFGESTEPPDPACDVQEMANCMAALQASEKPSHAMSAQDAKLLLAGDDEEIAKWFCEDMQVPFQCACKACNASHFKYWDNQYWTQDGPAKAMVLRMRQEARCHLVEHAGRDHFPVAHGCHNMYHTLCEMPLNSQFCPAVLSKHLSDSRYGVAQTLLDSRASWINPAGTCRGERGRDSELQCRKEFHETFVDTYNSCNSYHEFLVCMCDSCEHDVEHLTTGMAHYAACTRLNKTLPDTCAPWLADECEAEKGKNFCEAVVGSKAWKALQPKEEGGEEYGWDQDGMPWLTFCKEVVGTMADSEEALEMTVGKGWKAWCEDYLEKAGDDEAAEKMEKGPGIPAGTGIGLHPRLPISRMPAPRLEDHQDV
mmetsp:Transcript_38748/g.91475  ORF Transcript_38748/g.91475 Transcript_38748/m.91475 type:complete len:524 (-) Transcript_38748:40-1611(-)